MKPRARTSGGGAPAATLRDLLDRAGAGGDPDDEIDAGKLPAYKVARPDAS